MNRHGNAAQAEIKLEKTEVGEPCWLHSNSTPFEDSTVTVTSDSDHHFDSCGFCRYFYPESKRQVVEEREFSSGEVHKHRIYTADNSGGKKA